MYGKVGRSFLKLLILYGIQIWSFAIGYYIILHKDTKSNPSMKFESRNKSTVFDLEHCAKNKNCGSDAPYPFFDAPWLALVKTSTMFMGEIDFASIPMDQDNLNAIFGYIYYMAFIFCVVLVLMNLLNAVAVSDISKVIEESELECMLSNIEDISESTRKLGSEYQRIFTSAINPDTFMFKISKLYIGTQTLQSQNHIFQQL